MTLRIVFFGAGGPLALAALQALARARRPVAVVLPAAPPVRAARDLVRRLRRGVGQWSCRRLAARLGIPVLRFCPGDAARLAATLRGLAPDLLCVASFPSLLTVQILNSSRLGGINLHTSLLPRHRGADPLFWTYLEDDAQAGVSVHWLEQGFDSGDLILQRALALERGRPLADLYQELARTGASLLEEAVLRIEDGSAPRAPQDPCLATSDRPPRDHAVTIDFGAWGAERVWHVLRGLGGLHHSLIADAAGRAVAHGSARSFELRVPRCRPGTLERVRGGWRLHCGDGTVDVDAAPALVRIRHWLRSPADSAATRARGSKAGGNSL